MSDIYAHRRFVSKGGKSPNGPIVDDFILNQPLSYQSNVDSSYLQSLFSWAASDLSYSSNNLFISRRKIESNGGSEFYIPDLYINFSGTNADVARNSTTPHLLSALTWDSNYFQEVTGVYQPTNSGGALQSIYENNRGLIINFDNFAPSGGRWSDGRFAEAARTLGGNIIELR